MSTSVSANGRSSNRFQLLPEYGEHGKTSFAKHLRFKIGSTAQVAEYIEVTPAMAEEMLKYNTVEGCAPNRPCSKSTVAKYSDLITNRMWGVNGNGTSEPIIFSDKGRLLSGQHRLEAVVASGCTQRFLVIFGEPDGNFAFIDQGRRRTNQDIFAMHEVPNYSVMASAISWVVAYDNEQLGAGKSHIGGAPEQLYLWYLEHPKLQDSAPIGRLFAQNKLAQPSVMTAMHYICARKSRTQADEFFEQVATGIGITTKKSGADTLRKRLIVNLSGTAKLSSSLIAAYTIKAWNAHRNKALLGVVKWRTEQNPNEPFPRAQ